MSMSSGFTTMVAGSVAQSSVAERAVSQDKNAHAASAQQRSADSKDKALKAEGLGNVETESQKAGDRDADGRTPWERRHRGNKQTPSETPQHSIDPTGQTGKSLDLSG